MNSDGGDTNERVEAAEDADMRQPLHERDVTRWRDAARIVDAALDLSGSERSAYLLHATNGQDRLARDVQRWLAAIDAPSSLLDAHQAAAHETLAHALLYGAHESLKAGARVGAWRIVRVIGRGGMGDVYEAARADGAFEKRVALKVVRATPGSDRLSERFQQERALLATLDHPGIARLLDGGVMDDGAPYYVMEHVDGEPITWWCTRHQLSVAARVSLVRQLCDAMAYAHTRLIVHRDLKPSNVLVTTDGQVKVVDFGLAAVANRERPSTNARPTAPEGSQPIRALPMALTPSYASPEQFRGESASITDDVYSLTAVLYELFVGSPPFGHRMSWQEAKRAAETQAIAPPSLAVTAASALSRGSSTAGRKHARLLRGDMDAIVARGLARDPADRYATVDALRADLAAWLEHRPVQARPLAWHERSMKFVRRHVAGTVLSAAALLLLVGAAATAFVQASRATAAATSTAEANTFLLGLFRLPYPFDSGTSRQRSLHTMLDAGRQRVAARSGVLTESDAAMLLALSTGYAGLGDYRSAAQLSREAMEWRRRTKGDDDYSVALARADLAEALRLDGHFAAAIAEYDTLIPRVSREHGARAGVVAVLRQARARALMGSGDLIGAGAELRDVIDILADSGGRQPGPHAHALQTLGHIALEREQFREAESFYRSALTLRIASHGNAVEVANTQGDIAMTRLKQGDLAEADSLLALSRATKVANLGDLDPEVADDDVKLAWLALSRREPQRALTYLASARAGYASVQHLALHRQRLLEAATTAAEAIRP